MTRFNGQRLDGLIPLALVSLAALAWAFVPVFFSQLQGVSVVAALLATLLVNISKSVVAFVAMVVLDVGKIRDRVNMVRQVAVDRKLRTLLLLDGVFIAVSNLLFLLALSRGNGAIVTLILNAWPVVATVFLVRFMPKFRRVRGSQIAGAALAVLGLVFIVFASNSVTTAGHDTFAIVLAIGGAVGQGFVVVTHQLFLHKVQASWTYQPLWQTLRSAVAVFMVLLFLAPAVVINGSELVNFEWNLTGSLLLAGLFWTASGIFFHLGVARSENAFSTVPWLLAPLLSAVLVALAQGSSIPRSVFFGGVIVLAANAMLSLTIEPPRNVSVLVMTVVVVAACVLSIRGRNVQEFYAIGQTLGTFFAVSFGFLVSRLHQQRNSAKLLEIRWKSYEDLVSSRAGDHLENHANDIQRSELAGFRADRDGAAYLARSLLPISEALVVTVLGVGSCFILVYGRPDDPVGDLLTFLIVSSVLFSVVSLWGALSGQSGWTAEALPETAPSSGQVGEAVFGYVSALVAYLSITVAILASAPDWPSF